MAFQSEQPITPTHRGQVNIRLHIPDPTQPTDVQSGQVEIQIYYSDNSAGSKIFDLLARLQDDAEGQQLLVGLNQLRNYLLTRIENEILP